MGASSSSATITPASRPEEISAKIRDMAPAYEPYQKFVEENAIDGKTLLQYTSVDELLDETGSNVIKAHRIKLGDEFERFKSAYSSHGSAADPSSDRSVKVITFLSLSQFWV